MISTCAPAFAVPKILDLVSGKFNKKHPDRTEGALPGNTFIRAKADYLWRDWARTAGGMPPAPPEPHRDG